MSPATVLVVTGRASLQRHVAAYLERAGFSVAATTDGRATLERLRAGGVDVCVLDLTLPGLDGWAVLRDLRGFSAVPVLVLTPEGDEYERLRSFELGADGYLVPPFSPREVAARVIALLHRTRAPQARPGDALKAGGLSLDPGSQQVRAGGQSIALTSREFDLLAFLMRHPDQVFTRQQLLEQVWGYDFYGDARTVDSHVRKLREKLGPAAAPLVTVWGIGYRFEAQP